MHRRQNDSDATEPHDGVSVEQETGAHLVDHDASLWVEQFAASGPPVDPDRVWRQIAAQLDDVVPPPRSRVVRSYRGAGRALRKVARFATITGGGWGGPLVVGLFAILVIAALVAARTPQGLS